ncbi:hypothetical protein OOK29_26135 [Streptomyces phaeochromogenes]|nr:hypothetical protein [Streptomyces phaeochromogenes]MCX5601635.1 hypothetical protein [Streptomyces phaeochromogenes]
MSTPEERPPIAPDPGTPLLPLPDSDLPQPSGEVPEEQRAPEQPEEQPI